MRRLLAGLALALAASGLSFAADLTGPVWEKAPDRSDWAKAYPTHAAQAGISGAVKMRCAASEAGLLQNCQVISEAPTGEGFGAAALSLAAGMELKPTTADGKSVAGRSFIVPVKFDPGVLKGPTIITEPDWLRQPTNDELMNYWPAQATGRGGKALLHCDVTNRGLMDRCTVSGETPTGHGYGSAALAMVGLFVMRPMTVDGQPVGGGDIDIPIQFGPGDAYSTRTSAIFVITGVKWLAGPSAAEMAAVYPRSALGRVASAHVVVRCALRDDGSLEKCEGISELPSHEDFKDAAEKLIKDFRVPPPKRAGGYATFRVDVPFDFRDPSQPAPPVEIQDPIWIQGADSKVAATLFPAAAIKAGYRQGRVSVECRVADDGKLANCAAVTEEPAGYGFGDAALALAATMQMSLWTRQGEPVGGAKIVLPVRFAQSETGGATSRTQASPKP